MTLFFILLQNEKKTTNYADMVLLITVGFVRTEMDALTALL